MRDHVLCVGPVSIEARETTLPPPAIRMNHPPSSLHDVVVETPDVMQKF